VEQAAANPPEEEARTVRRIAIPRTVLEPYHPTVRMGHAAIRE
jgi:hypothetical protein